jgi:hypothetical protein
LQNSDQLLKRLNRITRAVDEEGSTANLLLKNKEFTREVQSLVKRFNNTLATINQGQLEVYVRIGNPDKK